MKSLRLVVEGSVECAVTPVLAPFQGKKAPADLEPAGVACFQREGVAAAVAVPADVDPVHFSLIKKAGSAVAAKMIPQNRLPPFRGEELLFQTGISPVHWLV